MLTFSEPSSCTELWPQSDFFYSALQTASFSFEKEKQKTKRTPKNPAYLCGKGNVCFRDLAATSFLPCRRPLTGLDLMVENECRYIFETPMLMGGFQSQIRGGRVQWETQGWFCPLSVRERLALLLDKQRPQDANGLHQKWGAVRDGEVSDHERLAGCDLRGCGWGQGQRCLSRPSRGTASPAESPCCSCWLSPLPGAESTGSEVDVAWASSCVLSQACERLWSECS